MSFFVELKRRNVLRVGLAYAISAWVLIQVMEIATDAFEAPAWVLKIVITLLLIGAVPTLIFSWVFEMTPEGLRKESDLDPDPQRQSTGKLNIAVIVLLVIAIGLFVGQRFLPGAGPLGPNKPKTVADSGQTPAEATTEAPSIEVASGASDDASIAVLPFADLSPEGDQEYFTDGISEEILNVLAGVDGLRVASRTSSFQFKGEQKSIPLIADELNVAHMLEGSVRKAGDRIRVTAQLIRADADEHLWSETYDRELTTGNIFEIQETIANAIVSALSDALDLDAQRAVEVKAVTDNLDAYDLYLQAQQSLTVLSTESGRRRVELGRRAVEADPNFADAWADLAFALAVLPTWDHSLAVAPYQRQALDAAEQALTLDPDNPKAWEATTTAYAYLQQWDDFSQAVQAARAEIPDFDATPQTWLGLGYLDKARAAAVRLQREDPELTHFWVLIEGLALEAMGKSRPALEKLETAVLYGYQGSAEGNIADIYRRIGETPAANALLSQELAAQDPELIPLLPHLHDLMAGDLTPVSADVRRFVALARELGFDADELARPSSTYGLRVPREVATALGHAEAVANTYFAPMDGSGPGGNSPRFWMWTPKLHHFRQTDAFRDRVRDTGMLAFWQAHGWPDLCRPVGEGDFACD
ncbi:MAG: hypothetical protein R3200_16640 [Xanthomonadales bacterium]|nr:hypothetical protein [Xanthomonadales bacterium]